MQELAQALQPLAVRQVQVEQHRVDIALATVDLDAILQRAGLDPLDRHAFDITVQGPDAEANQFVVVDEEQLACGERADRVGCGRNGQRGSSISACGGVHAMLLRTKVGIGSANGTC